MNNSYKKYSKDSWQNNTEIALTDNGNDYVAEFELAGFSKEDLSVSANDERLFVNAKNDTKQKEFKLNLYGIVSVDNIASNMKNGLLKITLPKKSVVGKRKVETT
jgi:HSP20 family molecular chaperone IbpA